MSKTPTPQEAERVAREAGGNAPASGPQVVCLADVKPERVTWLWKNYLPCGKVVTLDGDPGLGKSCVTLDIAARITTGTPMPDKTTPVKGAVLVLSAEDGLADTIRPRLDAAGADQARVVTITEMNDDDGTSRPVSLPGDLPAIEQVIRDRGVVFVIVDVLMAYLAGQVDSHRDQDIRRALHVLAKVAERTGCCVVVLRHLNKARGGSPMYRGGGSIGIIGAARAGFMIGTAPDDETGKTRVLAWVKGNLSKEPPALAYHLVEDELHSCVTVRWDGVSEHKAAGLLAEPGELGTQAAEARDAKSSAEAFLRKSLADGPQRSKEIEEDAEKGHRISERTLNRARKSLRIVARKVGTDWYMSLPEHEGDLNALRPPEDETSLPAKAAKGANPASTDTLGTLGTLPGLADSIGADESYTDSDTPPARFTVAGPGEDGPPRSLFGGPLKPATYNAAMRAEFAAKEAWDAAQDAAGAGQ